MTRFTAFWSGVALVLAGCAAPSGPIVQEPITVMTDRRVIPLVVTSDPELEARQVFAQVDEFSNGRTGAVRLQFMNAPESQRFFLQREALRRGIPVSRISYRSDVGPKTAARPVLIVDALVAVPPICDKRVLASYTFGDVRPDPRVGCANAVALAEQVSNPGDLVAGRPGGPFPGDGLLVSREP